MHVLILLVILVVTVAVAFVVLRALWRIGSKR